MPPTTGVDACRRHERLAPRCFATGHRHGGPPSLPRSPTPRAAGCGSSPPSSCRRGRPGRGRHGRCCCSRSWEAASRPSARNARLQQPAGGQKERGAWQRDPARTHPCPSSPGPQPRSRSCRPPSITTPTTCHAAPSPQPPGRAEQAPPHLVIRHGEDIAEAPPANVVRHLCRHQEGVLEGRSTHSGDIWTGGTGRHCGGHATVWGLSGTPDGSHLPRSCTGPPHHRGLQAPPGMLLGLVELTLRSPPRGSKPARGNGWPQAGARSASCSFQVAPAVGELQ